MTCRRVGRKCDGHTDRQTHTQVNLYSVYAKHWTDNNKICFCSPTVRLPIFDLYHVKIFGKFLSSRFMLLNSAPPAATFRFYGLGDRLKIYWLAYPEGRHKRAIERPKKSTLRRLLTHVTWCSCKQQVLQKLSLQPDQHVLDVGCGLGGAAFIMSQVRASLNYCFFNYRVLIDY